MDPLQCYRGVKQLEYVFNDEKELQNFLLLNKKGNLGFLPSTYSVQDGNIMECLAMVWNLDPNFTGNYVKDHQAICNTLKDFTTSWIDKYSTTIHSMNPNSVICRYKLQPVPDYLQWLKTGEAHYLPLEETAALKGTWVDIPVLDIFKR